MVASLEKNPGESVIGLPVWELIVGLQAGLFALFYRLLFYRRTSITSLQRCREVAQSS
jgi:hypothetical protein